MNRKRFHHIYGPVPSRRLRRSLGIDLVPFKTCTYDCIYCQLGRTTHKTIKRKEYVAIPDILRELEQKLDCPDSFDYISLAGSGEPTLHSGIGDLITKIKRMTSLPVAVLTNGSLLHIRAVQDALMPADLVLPSLDAGDELLFRYLNRPHRDISFEQMVDGLAAFTHRYKGEVRLEVFLLAGVTGIKDEVKKIASILRNIKLASIQMNTVVRPPAETYAVPVSPSRLESLKGLLPGRVEIISDRKPGDSLRPSNLDSMKNEFLSLLSRRPCTGTDVASSLGIHTAEALKYLDTLINAGKASTIRMNNKTFYTTKGWNDALRS